ncbi:MAG: hypothetical protein ABIK45_02560 [Pseudomonadota bacterium]
MLILQLAIFSALFIILRVAPIWNQRHRGCDAYFFMLCAETLRTRFKIPVTLPRLYLLEPQEQWYPPLFMVFLSFFPQNLLKKYYWLINHLLDLVVAIGFFVFVNHFAGPIGAWLFGLLYACDNSLVVEYQNLTSRPLSAILLFAFMACAMTATTNGPPWFFAALALGILLFYTHKMALQLLWFILPVLSITTGKLSWVALLGAIYVGAFLLHPSLFIKVVRAHWDIVSFFNRRWPWLNAHLIRNSPIYGDGRPTGFFNELLHGSTLAFLRDKFSSSLWAVMIAAAYPFSDESGFTPLVIFVAGTMAWALLTLLVPQLRCVGEGSKYLKYATPVALALASIYTVQAPWLWLIMLPLALRQIRNYALAYRALRAQAGNSGIQSATLLSMLSYLKEHRGNVMCIPLHLSDSVAYFARCGVLWGAHGYGFNSTLYPIYPVLLKTIEQCTADYELDYLLLDTRYASLAELRLNSMTPEATFGPLQLFRFDPASRHDQEAACG